jgi:hypothetical protein
MRDLYVDFGMINADNVEQVGIELIIVSSPSSMLPDSLTPG